MNKNAENKGPNYYYKALGQLHKFHKENKINARKEIIFEGARALDPLKKLNWNYKLIELFNKEKELFFMVFGIYGIRKIEIKRNSNSKYF